MINPRIQLIFSFFWVAFFTLALSIFWEFFLEDLSHHLLNTHHHEKTINDKWENVLTTIAFVVLALIIPFVLAIKRDSKRKKAEQQLNLMSEIVGNMAEGVSLVRASDNLIVYTNPKYDEMFGYDKGELLGKHVSILNIGTEDILDKKTAEITACLNETGVWQGEIEGIKKDGTLLLTYCNISAIQHHEYGKVIISVETDITVRKRAEKDLRAFSQKLVEAQETERKRIAGELHDGLGQNMTIINNTIQRTIKDCKNEAECKQHLEHISNMIVQSIDELRNISYNLRPPHLDQFGLKNSLTALINKTSKSSGIKMEGELDFVDNDIHENSQITIYRIVQEGLNNIIKHSSASEAKVEAIASNSKLHLTISDDGQGFELNYDKSQGYGIQGMSEKVKILKGSFNISSEKGKGTDIEIVLPIGI